MGVELLTAFHTPHNVRFKRIIEKCGFQYEATIEQGFKNCDGRLFDSVIYSIIKSDSFVLVQPSKEHEKQYQDMMDEEKKEVDKVILSSQELGQYFGKDKLKDITKPEKTAAQEK